MSFYCALILYIQDNKIDSIIPTMVLPTTEIIEPFNNGFPRLGPIALTEISSYKKTPERQDFRS